MKLLRIAMAVLEALFLLLTAGRSWRPIRFAKYTVAPRQGDRKVRERLLRRLPGRGGSATQGPLPAY